MVLSIIIPVVNESATINTVLTPLQALREKKLIEIIVVDGGSDDDTVEQSVLLADTVLSSPKGRSLQMNIGADASTGDVLIFLHADTIVPEKYFSELKKIFNTKDNFWGFSSVELSGSHWFFRIIEKTINIRSRLTAVATGDQALFISRSLFFTVGRFPQIPLMEDVAISKLLRHIKRPCMLSSSVKTSSRRWEENGIFKTIALMWWLRASYFFGVSPENLAKKYH
ncbi:MAG: TIGR04283 family arsenosugar biosynthesis glycosyltransferase [Cellvibrionaceae bacterium]